MPRNKDTRMVKSTAATEADLDVLANIEAASFSVPWTRRMLEVELMANPYSYVLTARMSSAQMEQDHVSGYICFWIVFDELRVMNLAVEPSARRQGIGLQLVTCALHDAIGQGATRALLEVRSSNTIALALYGKLGFQEYGVRKAYYTNPDEDAILMCLDPVKLLGDEMRDLSEACY